MHTNEAQVLDVVVATIAKATRYPAQILVPGADLEDDLGIDSVKQMELLIALGEAFDLRLEGPRDKSVRTIAQVAELVRRRLDARSADAARPAVQATPAPARPEPVAKPAPKPFVRASSSSAPPSTPRTPEVAPARNVRPARRGWGSGSSLEGKVALVTGSGRGVGRTIAELLAQRGATVVINSFHSREQGEETAAEICAAGGSAIHIWGSVAKEEHVDAMFAEIERRFGGLDILVCNASDGSIGEFGEMAASDWDRAFRTNVTGHHACAMRAARLMAPRGSGAIVTMSAVGAHQYIKGFGCQGVVKAAVEAMTRYLACELRPLGIRTNCVAAGPIYGELLDKLTEGRERMHHWEGITPGGSLCSALDIARIVGFLVSDEADAVNGAVWTVDRGVSAQVDGRLPGPALADLALAAE